MRAGTKGHAEVDKAREVQNACHVGLCVGEYA